MKDLATLIAGSTGLSLLDATTAVHYAVATHHVAELEKFPILVVQGNHGTGKSTAMRILEKLCYQPIWCEGLTYAEMRDTMAEDHTIFVEEGGDDISERLLLARYSKATRTVKRLIKNTWVREPMVLFGAGIVLHRRVDFKDPAVASRAVIIQTSYKVDGVVAVPRELPPLPTVGPLDVLPGSRVDETLEPLIQVGKQLNAGPWLTHIEAEKAMLELEQRGGRETEPQQMVYLALLECALEKGQDVVAETVSLSKLRQHLKDEGTRTFNSWQLSLMIRRLGFTITRSGGKSSIHTGGADTLRKVGLLLQVDDLWVLEG